MYTLCLTSYILLMPPLTEIANLFHTELVKKVEVANSVIAIGAVGVRVPLYLGHS